jgi:hypothetical protein
MLTIGEEWLVLALDESSGKFKAPIGPGPSPFLQAAEEMELIILRCQRLEGGGGNVEAQVRSILPAADDALVRAATGFVEAPEWSVQLPWPRPDSEASVLARLVESGVLRTEDRKRLGHTSHRHALAAPAVKAAIISRLSDLGAGGTPDARSVALDALVRIELVLEDALVSGGSRNVSIFAFDLPVEPGAGPIGEEAASALNETLDGIGESCGFDIGT